MRLRLLPLTLYLSLVACSARAPVEPTAIPAAPSAKPSAPPAPLAMPERRDALAIVRQVTRPRVLVVLYPQIRKRPLLPDFIEALPAIDALEAARIDPTVDIDGAVAGCEPRIGCFTLFTHHIRSERIRRFLELSAEDGVEPAEWLAEAPPTLRVRYATRTTSTAVFTVVNEHLLLVSLRPAPDLAAALAETTGLEPAQPGVAIAGRMAGPPGLLDDVHLTLRVEPDGALAGKVEGRVEPGRDPAIVAYAVEEALRKRVDYAWLTPLLGDGMDFRMRHAGDRVEGAVRLDADTLSLVAAGLRLAMRFR